MADGPDVSLLRLRRVALLVLVAGVVVFIAGVISDGDVFEVIGLVLMVVAVVIVGMASLRARERR